METDYYNAKYWKSKAVKRNLEIKELKKRIKEIIRGRDNWKEKYKQQRLLTEKYQKELEQIKKKIEKLL